MSVVKFTFLIALLTTLGACAYLGELAAVMGPGK
jgi:hypothetical protein